MCALFIDFKSAYNTINREMLWELVDSKQIFDSNELNFLKTLHDKIYFKAKGQKYYFMNGVG